MTQAESGRIIYQPTAKRDAIVTAIGSNAWASAMFRTLVQSNRHRTLEAYLAVDDLESCLAAKRRQVLIVEVNDKNFASCCRLGRLSIEVGGAVLVVGIAVDTDLNQRHALVVSGFAMIVQSFTELPRLQRAVERFTAEDDQVTLSVEESVELNLPWPRRST